MILQIQKLLDLELPLPREISENQANCLNAVQLYWGDTTRFECCMPEEFIAYVKKIFIQISLDDHTLTGDLTLIWTRLSSSSIVGEIQIDDILHSGREHPFYIIIQHAFVSVESDMIFHKKDLTETGPYEIICQETALMPYKNLNGFEITKHRRR